MLKRKAILDLYEDDVKRMRITPHPPHPPHPQHIDKSYKSYKSYKSNVSFSIINEDLDVVMEICYYCVVHDNDKSICDIYDCCGCSFKVFNLANKSYIN